MKLFLSFSGLLHAIVVKEVSREDLDTGLFFFGCTRAHALNPGGSGEFDERSTHAGDVQPAHETLLRAVKKAESTGRCRWHRLDGQPPIPAYLLLNELLVTNGVAPLPLPRDLEDYTYGGVREIAAAAGLAVEAHF